MPKSTKEQKALAVVPAREKPERRSRDAERSAEITRAVAGAIAEVGAEFFLPLKVLKVGTKLFALLDVIGGPGAGQRAQDQREEQLRARLTEELERVKVKLEARAARMQLQVDNLEERVLLLQELIALHTGAALTTSDRLKFDMLTRAMANSAGAEKLSPSNLAYTRIIAEAEPFELHVLQGLKEAGQATIDRVAQAIPGVPQGLTQRSIATLLRQGLADLIELDPNAKHDREMMLSARRREIVAGALPDPFKGKWDLTQIGREVLELGTEA